MSGDVKAVGGNALIAEILRDSFRIGPPLIALHAWLEQAEAKERQRRADVERRYGSTVVDWVPASAPISFSVRWDENGLVMAACKAGTSTAFLAEQAAARRAEHDEMTLRVGLTPRQRRNAIASNRQVEPDDRDVVDQRRDQRRMYGASKKSRSAPRTSGHRR